MGKIDLPKQITFHGVVFTRDFGGIYKNKKLGEALYLDSYIKYEDTDYYMPCSRLDSTIQLQLIINGRLLESSNFNNSLRESRRELEKATEGFIRLVEVKNEKRSRKSKKSLRTSKQ